MLIFKDLGNFTKSYLPTQDAETLELLPSQSNNTVSTLGARFQSNILNVIDFIELAHYEYTIFCTNS